MPPCQLANQIEFSRNWRCISRTMYRVLISPWRWVLLKMHPCALLSGPFNCRNLGVRRPPSSDKLPGRCDRKWGRLGTVIWSCCPSGVRTRSTAGLRSANRLNFLACGSPSVAFPPCNLTTEPSLWIQFSWSVTCRLTSALHYRAGKTIRRASCRNKQRSQDFRGKKIPWLYRIFPGQKSDGIDQSHMYVYVA